MISLDLKQTTPRQAIAEVATRRKVDLNLANVAEQGFIAALTAERFDISYKNETFWSAMLDLCKKGKLTPYADWQSPNKVSFQQGNPNFLIGPTRAVVGSSLIVLESVTSRFDAGLTGPRRSTAICASACGCSSSQKSRPIESPASRRSTRPWMRRATTSSARGASGTTAITAAARQATGCAR